MTVMELGSIHMCSHILVGVGQSVLYQCTQCVYVCSCAYICAHVHTHMIVPMQACVSQHILHIWDVH